VLIGLVETETRIEQAIQSIRQFLKSDVATLSNPTMEIV
jgi:hypothetical protein